jgi:hypothetical protein
MIMSPAEWLMTWGDHEQIERLQRRLSHRKERLFVAACCRQVLHLVPEEPCRLAVEAAEAFADGQISARKLRLVRRAAEASRGVLLHEWRAGGVASYIPRTRKTEADFLMADARSLAAFACELAAQTEYSLRGTWGRIATYRAREAAEFEQYYQALLAAPDEACATPPDGCWEEQAAEAAYREGRLAATRGQVEVLFDIFGSLTGPGNVDPAWLTWNSSTVAKMAAAIYADREWSILPLLADALEDAGCGNRDLQEHLRGPGPHVRGCWALDLLLGLR